MHAAAQTAHARMHYGPARREHGVPRAYSTSRMFNAPEEFAIANLSKQLRHLRPQVCCTRTLPPIYNKNNMHARAPFTHFT